MQDTKSGKELEPSKYRVRPTFGPHSLSDELADLRRLQGRGYYDNHDELEPEQDPDE